MPSTLGALIDVAVEAARAEDVGWLPAEVVAVHEPGVVDGHSFPLRVDVQIQVRYRRRMNSADDLLPGETLCPDTPGPGSEAVGDYQVVPDVPVLLPGLREWRGRGRPAVGEIGALWTSGRELIRWRQGEIGVTPPWMGGRLSGEFSSLNSSVWVPGLEVGPTETHAFGNTFTLGPPDNGIAEPAQLERTEGAWRLVGTSINLGGGPGALPPAYQAQTKAVLQALQAIHTATVSFWNSYVPVGPDAIALKTFYTSTLTPTLAVVTTTLAAMVGATKTVVE